MSSTVKHLGSTKAQKQGSGTLHVTAELTDTTSETEKTAERLAARTLSSLSLQHLCYLASDSDIPSFGQRLLTLVLHCSLNSQCLCQKGPLTQHTCRWPRLPQRYCISLPAFGEKGLFHHWEHGAVSQWAPSHSPKFLAGWLLLLAAQEAPSKAHQWRRRRESIETLPIPLHHTFLGPPSSSILWFCDHLLFTYNNLAVSHRVI